MIFPRSGPYALCGGGPQRAGDVFRGRAFDDIQSAAFQNPALTTGASLCAKWDPRCGNGLERIKCAGEVFDLSQKILVERELIVRETNGAPSALKRELIVFAGFCLLYPLANWMKSSRKKCLQRRFWGVKDQFPCFSVCGLGILALRRRQFVPRPYESLYWLPPALTC